MIIYKIIYNKTQIKFKLLIIKNILIIIDILINQN
jgi:hypothetical protein